jgi:hypothetical protein
MLGFNVVKFCKIKNGLFATFLKASAYAVVGWECVNKGSPPQAAGYYCNDTNDVSRQAARY